MVELTESASLSSLPQALMHQFLFPYFNSRDLFGLRAVCSEWQDIIKLVWC